MEIVTISGKIGNAASGIGKYETEVVSRLRKKHDVRTIEYDVYRFNARNGVVPMVLQTFYKLFFSLAIRFRVRGAPVIHVLSQEYAYLLFFLPLSRTVLTVHDIIPHRHSDAPNIVFRWYELLNIRGIRRARHIITDSRYTADQLISELHIPRERIEVIYPGVAEHYHPYEESAVEQFRQSRKLPGQFLLYVGSDRPRKNVDTLIEAFARARDRIPGLTLVLIGGSEHTAAADRVDTLVTQLHLTSVVFRYRNVPEHDMPLFYSAATALVFPSSMEGFGWPPLEAFACGCPAVTTTVTALAETAGGASLGIPARDINALADAICAVVQDSTMRNKLIGLGKKHVAQFSWDTAMRKVEEVYNRIQHENTDHR